MQHIGTAVIPLLLYREEIQESKYFSLSQGPLKDPVFSHNKCDCRTNNVLMF